MCRHKSGFANRMKKSRIAEPADRIGDQSFEHSTLDTYTRKMLRAKDKFMRAFYRRLKLTLSIVQL